MGTATGGYAGLLASPPGQRFRRLAVSHSLHHTKDKCGLPG